MTHASPHSFRKPSEPELRERLTPLQYRVTQHDATEPPFDNAYWNEHREGLYVDIVNGEPLFSSRDKFDSGTGWPSFARPLSPERVSERLDPSAGMPRVEVRSSHANSHLGHVFEDGPLPTRRRYCINSAALRFVPVEQLQAEGYGEYLALFEGPYEPLASAFDNACAVSRSGGVPGCVTTLETAILAGGSFWGMEELLRTVPGVLDTEVGYSGGSTEHPTYAAVKSGGTGHAEVVRVIFDPSQLSFEALLERWFFRMHDPTTENRQGNDRGSQYRSAIFFTTSEQRRVAELVRKRVDESGRWRAPVVTEISQATSFTTAEAAHQDYLKVNPDGYTCHFLRD